MTIARAEFVERLAERVGLTVAAASDVMTVWEKLLLEAVSKGEGVKFPGVFTIEVVDRAARGGRNPRTGEAITIAARKAVKITPGAQLKAAVK